MYDISQFNPRRHKPVRVSPTTRVYDVDEGILEIAKEGGRASILNEAKRLTFFEETEKKRFLKREKPLSFAMPKVLHFGGLSPWQYQWPEDYVMWMLTTKLEGDILTAGKVKSLPKLAKRSIANALGYALADLHAYLRESGISSRLESTPQSKENAALFDFGVDVERNLAPNDWNRLQSVRELVADGITVSEPIHGDLGLSKIVFAPDLGEAWSKVSGVCGFAKVRMGRVEEDLTAFITEMPFLKRGLIRAYEKAARREVDKKYMEIYEARDYLVKMIMRRYIADDLLGAYQAQKRLDELIYRLEGPGW